MRQIILLSIALLIGSHNMNAEDNSTKKERNYIREGNSLFQEKRYSEAETLYKKALEENASSPLALFNLATTYLKMTNPSDTTRNSPLNQVPKMLDAIAHTADADLASKAYYDLGNLSFNRQDYAQSIEYYKNALRKNPDDDMARENLRLAQKKLQEQQQNQQQNQDRKQDHKDQQKQQQDQNKQKDKKGQDQQQPQNQNQNENMQQPPKGGMSKENAEQILQTIQNEEKNTQDKVNRAKMQQMKSTKRTGKQW